MMRRKQLSVLLTALILTMTVTASGCGAKKEDAVILPDTEEVMTVVDTETETEEPTEIVEATETVEETEVMESTEAQTAEADADGYTYETLDQTMYAKSQVNVRSKASQDGEKLGALKANEEVKVTGRCKETGWYRISYAGSTGYVSDKYLTDTKASTQASKGTTKNTNSSAGENNTSGKNRASTGTASGTGNGSTSGTTASNGSNSGSQTASGNRNNGGSNASGGNNGGSSTPAQTPSDNGGNSTPSTPDSGNNGGNTTPSTPDNGGSTGVDLSTGGSNYNMSLDGLPPMPEGPAPDYSGDDSNLVMGGGTFEIN